MKKFLFVTVLTVLAGFVLGGCESMVYTDDQQKRRVSRITDINRRLLAEDVEALLLLEQPSSLTQWHVPFD